MLIMLPVISGCGSGSKDVFSPAVSEPAALVGLRTCVNCHTDIGAEWLQGAHGNYESVDEALQKIDLGSRNTGFPYYGYSSFSTDPKCSTCHDPLAEGKGFAAFFNSTGNDSLGKVDRPVVGCESCHGGGGRHFGTGPIDKYRVAASANGSAQFNTCAKCHQIPDAAGVLTGTEHPPIPGDPKTLKITDTHVGTPGNWPGGSGANTKDITGYALKPKEESACTICHNPHKADATINRQYASSRHADKSAAGAWAHYNWSRDDRKVCQRCHTTTGIIAYTTFLLGGGDPATFVGPLSQDDNFVPQMLQCNGCHTNNKGGLRNPGPVTETYADNDVQKYPDLSGSNLCLTCHVGRESGGTIKARSGSWNSLSFTNSHYLTAGGTLFAKTGYTFTGRNYDNVAFFLHDSIGRPDRYAVIDAVEKESGVGAMTGKNGPCISCHMTFNNNGAKHVFLPIAVERKDPSEPLKITKVTAIASTLCAKCHKGERALTVADIEEQKTLLAEAMEAFDVQLQQRGFFFALTSPYFFKSPGNTSSANAVRNWLSAGDTDLTGAATGKNNMGAAFNFNLIEHDPGAFVHNRFYVKRLIYDSIDWLDDNVMNDSVKATLDSTVHAGKPYQAGAKAYILSTSGGRP